MRGGKDINVIYVISIIVTNFNIIPIVIVFLLLFNFIFAVIIIISIQRARILCLILSYKDERSFFLYCFLEANCLVWNRDTARTTQF